MGGQRTQRRYGAGRTWSARPACLRRSTSSVSSTTPRADATKEQEPAYQALLASLKNEDPDLDLDDYRRGVVAEKWDVLLQCDFAKADERANVIERITPDDLIPASARPRTRCGPSSGGRPAASTPGGSRVRRLRRAGHPHPARVDRPALQNACEMGDVVRVDMQPDRGHSDVDVSPVLAWIADRFADARAEQLPSFISPPLPAMSAQPRGAGRGRGMTATHRPMSTSAVGEARARARIIGLDGARGLSCLGVAVAHVTGHY